MEEPFCRGGQIDFVEARSRPGGENPQIVGHFGKIHRAGTQHRGNRHKAVHVLGGVDEIRRLHQIQTGHRGNASDNLMAVVNVGVEAGSHSGAAQIQHPQFLLALLQPL